LLNLIETSSDVSRTNQLKIVASPEEVAEKLFLYLYRLGRGVEYFQLGARDEYPKNDKRAQAAYFRERHKAIKLEIQKRLAEYGEKPDLSNIQYFLSNFSGANYVFFLSPSKSKPISYPSGTLTFLSIMAFLILACLAILQLFIIIESDI